MQTQLGKKVQKQNEIDMSDTNQMRMLAMQSYSIGSCMGSNMNVGARVESERVSDINILVSVMWNVHVGGPNQCDTI